MTKELTLIVLNFVTDEVDVHTGVPNNESVNKIIESYNHSSLEFMIGNGKINIKTFNNEQNLILEYLNRLKDYHGEDTSWHIKNKSDVNTLRDELIDLGDEKFVKQNKDE